jgi:hypothetical protein
MNEGLKKCGRPAPIQWHRSRRMSWHDCRYAVLSHNSMGRHVRVTGSATLDAALSQVGQVFASCAARCDNGDKCMVVVAYGGGLSCHSCETPRLWRLSGAAYSSKRPITFTVHNSSEFQPKCPCQIRTHFAKI